MPRVGMEPKRTAALIEAVIHEIGETGSMDVTVSQIARRAGMSSALAHHYFGSKSQMFVAAMRHILTLYGNEVRSNLSGISDPRARLEIIIRTSFSELHMRPETISTWLNFYVHAQTAPQVARLLRVYHRRIRSNLLCELRQLLPAKAVMLAEGIASIIDGAYIRWVLCPVDQRPTHPERIALDYLDCHLAQARITA